MRCTDNPTKAAARAAIFEDLTEAIVTLKHHCRKVGLTNEETQAMASALRAVRKKATSALR